MNSITINAVVREVKLRKIRESGMVPGVIYGDKKRPVNISVNMNDVLRIIKDFRNSVITLKTPSSEEQVVLKNVSRNVVTDKIIHVDFLRIAMDRKIDVKVPIKFIGEPYGVKTQGGVVEFDMREFNVRCLPSEIPHEIPVDISLLKIGDSIRIKDLKFDKFEIRENPENLIVSVISAKEEVVAPVQAAAAGAEPEVIEKGKKAEGEVADDAVAPKDADKKESPKKEEKK